MELKLSSLRPAPLTVDGRVLQGHAVQYLSGLAGRLSEKQAPSIWRTSLSLDLKVEQKHFSKGYSISPLAKNREPVPSVGFPGVEGPLEGN